MTRSSTLVSIRLRSHVSKTSASMLFSLRPLGIPQMRVVGPSLRSGNCSLLIRRDFFRRSHFSAVIMRAISSFRVYVRFRSTAAHRNRTLNGKFVLYQLSPPKIKPQHTRPYERSLQLLPRLFNIYISLRAPHNNFHVYLWNSNES